MGIVYSELGILFTLVGDKNQICQLIKDIGLREVPPVPPVYPGKPNQWLYPLSRTSHEIGYDTQTTKH